MPAKPLWYQHLPRILEELRRLPRPWVDRATVEFLLGVGRRRAQQIMAPCIRDRVGANGLADRDTFIAHLEQIAAGEEAYYEVRRRHKVAAVIGQLRRDRIDHPKLIVEAPTAIVHQEFDALPPGLSLEPGRITVEFDEPRQALEKLLALAMAAGNDFARFEKKVARPVRNTAP